MTKILMIMLDTIEDVKKFVQEMNNLPYGAKVYSRGYIVNASSIMGLFSLDLSEPVKVEFDEELTWEDIEPFKIWEVHDE